MKDTYLVRDGRCDFIDHEISAITCVDVANCYFQTAGGAKLGHEAKCVSKYCDEFHIVLLAHVLVYTSSPTDFRKYL